MLARAAHEAARAGRGRLKIFFGAVPGVGKTYAMLEAARTARQRGLDVVIGWLETHGRAETAAMAEGFEHLPPRAVAYRGVTLDEFDLDAALERRPALLLVDELPHTNAPGSRHAQRWQDVAELLEAGVSVWTTLNVQHVESLNDVVTSITGVSVRETVPDSLLDRADEIELVDLPPDDLLRRLSDGKVYVPAQIAQATENFFKKGNLIALRELAMRRAAERVEAQAAEWRREHVIAETWRTRERLLVAVDDTPASADLIRACRRMASSLHAPWIALTVEDPGFVRLPAEDRERLAENLALAQRLGAETLVVVAAGRGRDWAGARASSRSCAGQARSTSWSRRASPRKARRADSRAPSGVPPVASTCGRWSPSRSPPPCAASRATTSSWPIRP